MHLDPAAVLARGQVQGLHADVSLGGGQAAEEVLDLARADPGPQLEGLSKEMIRYERDDGVKMTATLYLPPAYEKERGPLPTLVWAYPQEFKSADAAGQVFTRPGRPAGYLVHR